MSAIVGSCDTFVALAPATQHGMVVFGKNSDRPRGEVQEVIHFPAADYSPDGALNVQCTYISIPQVAHTHAVVLSKPVWMWGAEMGANEHGLCVGNEAVWTRLNSTETDLQRRLLGMDMVRLALERADSARQACDVIAALLADHGQGGPCSDTDHQLLYHNSFLLADPREAWVLETAGHLWAAQRVISGVRNISNCLSIGEQIDLAHPDLRSEAKSLGFWDGTGQLNFRKAFGLSEADDDGEDDCSRFAAGRRLLLQKSEVGQFDVQSMLEILRDGESGICRDVDDPFHTAASQVSLLSPPGQRPCCHWFTATPDPRRSVFKPFVFVPDARISAHTSGGAPQHRLYRRHAAVMRRRADDQLPLEQLRRLEQSCVVELLVFLQNYTPEQAGELRDLFKDCVDSELQFYK